MADTKKISKSKSKSKPKSAQASTAKSRPYMKSKAPKDSRAHSRSSGDSMMVRDEISAYGDDSGATRGASTTGKASGASTTGKADSYTYNYGDIIRDLRVSCGFTQNYVAESLGVTPGYISKVENNRTTLSLKLLKKYAELTGASLDSIVGQLDQDYKETALDNALITRISELSEDEKERLLNVISAIFD